MHSASGGLWRRGCHATGTCPQSRVAHQVVEGLLHHGARCCFGNCSGTSRRFCYARFLFLLLLYRYVGKTSAVHGFSFVFFLMHKNAMEMLLIIDPCRSYYFNALKLFFFSSKADFLFIPLFI